MSNIKHGSRSKRTKRNSWTTERSRKYGPIRGLVLRAIAEFSTLEKGSASVKDISQFIRNLTGGPVNTNTIYAIASVSVGEKYIERISGFYSSAAYRITKKGLEEIDMIQKALSEKKTEENESKGSAAKAVAFLESLAPKNKTNDFRIESDPLPGVTYAHPGMPKIEIVYDKQYGSVTVKING